MGVALDLGSTPGSPRASSDWKNSPTSCRLHDVADLNKLLKLFQAIARRDWTSADASARDVAAAEERIGHHSAAQRLRGALNPDSAALPSSGASLGSPPDAVTFLSSALSRLPADRLLDTLRLTLSTREVLAEVLAEWRHRPTLLEHGLKRRTKLLFHGPPGCGKSVTARAIWAELGLPVYVVRFDAIVGAYLGQTALHLRQLFRFAETTPSIILLDEIDALGKRRGSPLDVGELDRVVIALLQELEHSHPAGLLVATSNLAQQLDLALWRRFDIVLKFPRPAATDLRAFCVASARTRNAKVSHRAQTALSHAKTYADVERIIDDDQRRMLIASS